MSEQKSQSSTSPKTQRRIVLIFGAFMLFFSLYILAFLVPDVLRTAGGAEMITLERAADIATDESTYVRIEDAVWDCDTIYHVRGKDTNSTRIITRFTEAFVTDGSSPASIVMLASMSGDQSCLDLRETIPTGYLNRMTPDKQQALTNDARLARYYDAEIFLDFCGYCGQGNSMIGVIMGILFALAGVGVLILGLRMPQGDKTKHMADEI